MEWTYWEVGNSVVFMRRHRIHHEPSAPGRFRPSRFGTSVPARLLSRDDERRLTHVIRAAEAAASRRQSGEGQPGDDTLIGQGDAARRRFVEANADQLSGLTRREALKHL